MKTKKIIILFFVILLGSFSLVNAADTSLEKDLQTCLIQSRTIILRLESMLSQSGSVTSEYDQLKRLSDDIRASHMLLKERFKARDKKLADMGAKAPTRHAVMSDAYIKTLDEFLALIESLPKEEDLSVSFLNKLKALLDRIIYKKKPPIFGSLPYRSLNYPSKEPADTPSITPAYKGGNKTIVPDDLNSTPEAPISDEIVFLAESLEWNPVLIYEWVKNNIETEWYWGCMKGAVETLHQKSGNDCDQATLLIALMRASGFPSRYIRGVIEFYPGMEAAQMLTGIKDPEMIAAFFRKAGIPCRPVISGGKISNFQIEHIWIESRIPFANFHGDVVDDYAKTWLGLDTSIKAAGFISFNNPMEIPEGIDFSDIRDQYLTTLRTETPLEYIQSEINAWFDENTSEISYDDLLQIRTTMPEILNILPASLQFRQISITDEFHRISEDLIHMVRFFASDQNNHTLFDITTETYTLSNQEISITYEPETVEDQEIINAYGNLDNTPAYLVKLRPTLEINRENMIVAKDGLAIGSEYHLSIELISPNSSEKITNTHIAGNYSAIGIVSQKPVTPETVADEEKDAWRLLHEEAISYIDRWNQAEDELASLMHLTLTRPTPTVVTLGGVIDVTYLLDTPHGFEWKGVYVDADLRTVGISPCRELQPGDQVRKEFMMYSALQGSILENRILEDDFQVESISTAKLFSLANNSRIPILTIDKNNIETILPPLPFDEAVKQDIANGVNQGLVVKLPESHISYEDWTGIGYIMEDPDTGTSGWMLSGMIAGGMTAGGLSINLLEIFAIPYSGQPNNNPDEAFFIFKIRETDMQKGIVGEFLPSPLKVMVFDKEQRPVKGADVTFSVRAGGGTIQSAGPIKTDAKGIASAELILGEKTGDNPSYQQMESEGNEWQQVGKNLIDASLASGTGIAQPFIAYGFPKKAKQIRNIAGDYLIGPILSFSGFISVIIEDEYGNPVSNLPVEFSNTPDGYPLSTCTNPNQDQRPYMFIDENDPCLPFFPTWGECTSQTDHIQINTSIRGTALAHTISGGMSDSQFFVTATYGDLSTTFHRRTLPFGSCDQTDAAPSEKFYLNFVYPADDFGNNINGVAVGTKMKFSIRPYYLSELSELGTECGGQCTKIIGSREYKIEKDFTNTVVTASGQECIDIGGLFECTYRVTSGLNTVDIQGSAAVSRKKFNNICSQPPLCPGSPEDISIVQDDSTSLEIYGVQVTASFGPDDFILVDENGLSVKDYTITSEILPADYKSDSAWVVIKSIGQTPYTHYIQRDAKGGEDTVTLVKGTWFDKKSTYTAQVILNMGRTFQNEVIEIKSREIPLKIVNSKLSAGDVRLSTNIDRINGDICGSEADLKFEIYSDALVTIEIDGSIITPISGPLTIPIKNVPFPEGMNQIPVSREMVPVPGEYEFKITAVFTEGVSTVEVSTFGKIIHEIKISESLPIGHTFVKGVDLHDGHISIMREDFSIAGRGPSLNFSRSYGSAGNQSSGPMGAGWRHAFNSWLIIDGCGKITIIGGEGSGTRFSDPVSEQGDKIYKPQKGFHGSLIFHSHDGSYDYYTKTRIRYHFEESSVADEYTLRFIEDPNGNRLTLTYNEIWPNNLITVQDASGRTLEFEYEPYGVFHEDRIVRVTGPMGLEVSFEYDIYGNLISAARGTRHETYEYSSDAPRDRHNLKSITDPNGNVTKYAYYAEEDDFSGYPDDFDWKTDILFFPQKHEIIKSVIEPLEALEEVSTEFEYILDNNIRKVKNGRNFINTYTLNVYGSVTKLEDPLGNPSRTKWALDVGIDDIYIVEKIDARENMTEYEYDAKGNIILETDPYGNTIITTWDQQFSLPLTRTDRNNVTQTWHYDNNGNLEWYEDGDGKRTDYIYNTYGQRTSMTNPLGFTTFYTYDQWGNPKTVLKPEGSLTRFEYDARSRLVSITDPENNKTEYTYNALDYPETITLPIITAYNLPAGSTNIQEFEYDPMGNLLKETNRVGLTLTYFYTPRNQVKTVTINIGGTKTFGYDENGNLTSETDWKNVSTTHTYDVLDRRDSTTNRLGHTMYMNYDAVGNLTNIEDYEGRITTHAYDNLNRLTDTWQPAMEGRERGHIQKTYYNEADPETNLKTETDQEDNPTTFEYNGRYLVSKRINALTHEYDREYDDNGNLVKEIDEEDNPIEYQYDKQNRRILMIQVGNIQTEFQYDMNGNQTHVIDAGSKDTETGYDKWNRAYEVIDPDGNVTTTEYDGEGKAVKVNDGNSNDRISIRDRRGLILTAIDAEGKETWYTYDLNGNVETVTNANHVVTKTTYDAEDRPLTITQAFGTADARSKEFVSRDKMGNPLEVKDFMGNITRIEYNALHLPKKVYDPAPFDSQFIETTYYKTGRVKSVKNRRGFTTDYEYDVLNREAKVTDPLSKTVETTYDRVGNVKTVKDKRDIVIENFYDDLYRLIRTERAGVRLVTNEYDDVGNLTAVIDANNNRTNHTYNNRNLLYITTYPDITTEIRTYDGVGNLLIITNPAGITTYTYDTENRETSVEFAGEKTTKLYDAIGNLVSVTKPEGNCRIMAYDDFNQLITVIDDPTGLIGTMTKFDPRYTRTDGLNFRTRYEYDANDNLRHQYDPKNNHVEITDKTENQD